MKQKALLIGNSDGIGFGMTKQLLKTDYEIIGISRSDLSIDDPAYSHHTADVRSDDYEELISEIISNNQFDLCIYFVGLGEEIDLTDMSAENIIFETNLNGMVKTASAVIPHMVKTARGHFIGLSSLADELLSAEAPSYHASKAGFSNYLEGLALALRPKNVFVTNVRFGFVDTKMAKGDFKPLMMSVEKAVDHLKYCIRKKPVRFTVPKLAIPLVKFRKLMMKLGAK